MAILTVEELQDSREAQQAGVASESDEHITKAIEDAELSLRSLLGYNVVSDSTSVAFTTRSRAYNIVVPGERIRSVSAITADGSTVGITNLDVDHFTLVNDYPFYGRLVVTGTFGFTETDDEYKIAKNWVLKAAVDDLKQTKSDGPGGIPYDVDSITAEGVSIRMPASRRPDIKELLGLLPIHPAKRRSGIYTIGIDGGATELPHIDRVFLGLETVDDL